MDRSAVSVGGGILLSRLAGFARDVIIGFFFGTGLAVDAYNVALRIPNAIRNLLGEGTLSASFVPVYSEMLEQGGPGEAPRLARSVLGIVLGVAGLLAALGVLTAPLLTSLLVPEWEPDARALTTRLVRILFPMAGVMIVGAWCLGVLNSHRSFFLPFVAPVAWNLAQIAGLLLGGALGWEPLIEVLAWATLLGSLLQVGIQIPAVVRRLPDLRPALRTAGEPVRRVVRNAVPVISSQGVFQLSSVADVFLAGFLAHGAIAGLYFAQRLAYLPLSLFGISVAAASLPEMSRERAGPALRARLRSGFLRILWFVFPVAVAYTLFGDAIVGVLFERGAFGGGSTRLVAAVLLAYSLGLVATSSVKLFASGFHALQDTRTPLRYAALSVFLGTGGGALLMFAMEAAGWGAFSVAGLILGGALGAWINLGLLWHGLRQRIGGFLGSAELARVLRICVAGGVGGLAGARAREWLEAGVPGTGLLAEATVLAGTLLVAGVPYLVLAGSPAPDPRPDSDVRRPGAR